MNDYYSVAVYALLAACWMLLAGVKGYSPSDPLMAEFMRNTGFSDRTEPFFIKKKIKGLAKKKPSLLYLPGLDGSGISSSSQFKDLEASFDFKRLCIPPACRLSFDSLAGNLTSIIESSLVAIESDPDSQNAPLTIMGESFGGLLACSVCLRLEERGRLKNVQLVLVNPATSFQRTPWESLVPILTKTVLPVTYPFVGGGILALTALSNYQARKATESVVRDLVEQPLSLGDNSLSLLKNFYDNFNDRLPSEVVEFRVKDWCAVGSKQVTSGKIARVLSKIKSLVIVGTADNLLPSGEEGKRLLDLLGDNCTVREIKGASHLVFDDQVNATQIILSSPLFKKTPRDPVLDWNDPPPGRVKRAIDEQVSSFKRRASPKVRFFLYRRESAMQFAP